MKLEIEKDFLKQFEKLSKYDKKLEKLADKVKRQYALNSRLHYYLEKEINRIFFRNKKRFIKNGEFLLNNVNNMVSLLNEEYSIFESQEKIAEKMLYIEENKTGYFDTNKKSTATRLGNILKRRSDLLKQGIQAQIESFKLDEKVGKYAIKCGKGLMSTENFIKEYDSLSKKAENFGLTMMKNSNVLEELNHNCFEAVINFQKAWIIK